MDGAPKTLVVQRNGCGKWVFSLLFLRHFICEPILCFSEDGVSEWDHGICLGIDCSVESFKRRLARKSISLGRSHQPSEDDVGKCIPIERDFIQGFHADRLLNHL